eukprot:TRINITY_DN13238_c0_g1_i1.p1 TRINITY_DN13238_c0_g1~~TRINITY_DN13238_c0_g1_i1.p1  ORF type:complete len:247 (-),score=57.15 TRINITY_DN13238_c0_g1_i1:8-748(-)
MSELKFADQALNRYNPLQTKIKRVSKGLFLLADYFVNTRKHLDKFCTGLQSSLAPLAEFLQAEKSNKDSITAALSAMVKSEAEYFAGIKAAIKQYQTEVIDVFELFIRNYENESKTALSKGSKLISLIEAQKAKANKAKDNYSRNATAFFNPVDGRRDQAILRKKAMDEAKSEYQNLIDYCNNLVRNKSAEYKKDLELLEQNEETRVSIIAKSLAKFFVITQELSLIHICRCRRYAVCRSRWSPYH